MSKYSIKQLTEKQANELGVSSDDYKTLTKVLGKEPDLAALMLYSLIWTDKLTENDVDLLQGVMTSNGEIGKFIHLGKGKVFYSKVKMKKSKAAFSINAQKQIAYINAALEQKDQIKVYIDENKPNEGVLDINNSVIGNPFALHFAFGTGHVPESEINKVIADAGTSHPVAAKDEAKYKQQVAVESVPYPDTLKEVALAILSSPKIASRKDFFAQKGNDAFQLEDTPLVLALTLSANSNYNSKDDRKNVAVLLAEAARKLACRGAFPIAINTALLFNEEGGKTASKEIEEVTEGIKKFGETFNLPVTSGLIDFRKDLSQPLSVFGLAGVQGKKSITADFKSKGDLIFIIGKTVEDIDGSVYLSEFHKNNTPSAPFFDFKSELVVHNVIRNLIDKELINAAESCSLGGLFMALTKMSFRNELGFDIVTDAEIREDAYLFGESAGRVVVTVSEDVEDEFIEFMMQSGVSYTLLGHVTQGKMVVDDEHFGFIQGAKEVYNKALYKKLIQ
jgi:phosphoribosylformylglycinamidine (FGAM) synthase-like enzyme